jgi:hypothetical protein
MVAHQTLIEEWLFAFVNLMIRLKSEKLSFDSNSEF